MFCHFELLYTEGPQLQIREGTEDNFSYFSMKTYVVTPH